MRLIDVDALMRAMYERAFETDDDTMWQSGCWVRYRAIEEVVKEQPTIEPEQRWIPTSEKLPEYDKPVLLSMAWGKTEIGFWTQRGWMIVACSYREFEQSAVTAWMPLPELYVERRQDADND